MAARERWTEGESQAWYDRQPWLVGCNYIPGNAVNQLEMWQGESFDPKANDRELGWAASAGFNTVRVYLHDIPWALDAAGFAERIDQFLDIASGHGIRTMLVLFDGVWNPHPAPGPQPQGTPRVHNSGWVQSPGAAVLGDPARHDEMEGYVRGVIRRFASDERVLAWDLFNEPDNPNPAYTKTETQNKGEMALRLLLKSYEWARLEGPVQPLTSGVWRPEWVATGSLSEMDRAQLSESDVISFHAYVKPHVVAQRVAELQAHGRPVLLTEYLARPYGSTFEALLPLLKERRVGAYSWGLVAGKTNTIYPWESWTREFSDEPELWFHDLLREDGSPYLPAEVAFLREITRG